MIIIILLSVGLLIITIIKIVITAITLYNEN